MGIREKYRASGLAMNGAINAPQADRNVLPTPLAAVGEREAATDLRRTRVGRAVPFVESCLRKCKGRDGWVGQCLVISTQ